METEKSKVEWTPELEQRYQYVQKQYDVSRGIGLDLLKILLGMTITLAAVPIAFHDKITTLFSGRSIYFIYLSWIFILLALLSRFVAYLFIFEGYYYQAHFEASRWLEGSQDDVNKYSKNSNNFFDLAHRFGVGSLVFFVTALTFIIIPISFKLTNVFTKIFGC